MVRINGQDAAVAGMTLADYLRDAAYDTTRIAVERNGDIVVRADYKTTLLADGDTLEIVTFVGGG